MIACVLFVLFLLTGLIAEPVVLGFPEKKQLYARDVNTDSADVLISGTVDKSTDDYTSMSLRVYRDNALLSTFDRDLAFSGSTASFQFQLRIKAELHNYTMELVGVNGDMETVVRTADSIVAGDVYIINGQSNAEAKIREGDANVNQSPFIRVLGSGHTDGAPFIWNTGQGNTDRTGMGNCGQWGLRLARLIVDNHQVPVAIFNGARGASPVTYFKPDADRLDQSSNYGRLLKRLQVSGLDSSVRAILWHQGEQDADVVTVESYISHWKDIYNAWMEDYPSTEKVYVFQIRNGCSRSGKAVARIKEAARQLARDLDNVEIMSTSGEDQHTDKCHFGYENGYKRFADNIYRLVDRDLYGAAPAENIEPPQLERVERTGDKTLTLFLKNRADTYTWDTGAETEFRASDPPYNHNQNREIISVEQDGFRVILTYKESLENYVSISFFGHDNEAEPLIRNANGVGMVHFYEFPISLPVSSDPFNAKAPLEQKDISETIVFKANGSCIHIQIISSGFQHACITDVLGTVVETFDYPAEKDVLTWDRSGKEPGMYYLHVKGRNRLISTPIVLLNRF